MVYKLVRTDTEEPCKIQLPFGTHLIGRGKFLDCDDKRVSRKHGEIEVTEDAINVKALHQNPCFYTKKGTLEMQILKQHNIISLKNGDKFGLLPDSFWYEVLYCAALDVRNSPEISAEENTEPLDEHTILETQIDHNKTDDEHFELNESVGNGKAQSQSLIGGSPSVLPAENKNIPSSIQTDSPIPPIQPQDIQRESPTAITSTIPNSQESDKTDTSPSSPKRCHSPLDSKENIKKIKLEADNVKQEPDAQPGPSGDQGNAQSGDINGDAPNTAMPPSPQKPNPAAGRERCMYGANCYRRNPAHKAQFAHPVDADWGAGERGVCPHGARCRRRDPRHWRDHSHPPGAAPQPHRPPAKQRKRAPKWQKSDDDIEEDTQDIEADDNLIVTGKRSRKTINRQSWSGSEPEDEDPYGTDESDEWKPDGGNQSQSQSTQDLD